MLSLSQSRARSHLSQRRLAKLAGLSYKALQLLEAGGQNARLSTLEKIAEALAYPKNSLNQHLEDFFKLPQDSLAIKSEEMLNTQDWHEPFFNFVDAFRREKNPVYVAEPPHPDLPAPLRALLASTAEVLCNEIKLAAPWWCNAVGSLSEPWFVSGMENLKAPALVESPLHFRKRNIFVLNNFLERY